MVRVKREINPVEFDRVLSLHFRSADELPGDQKHRHVVNAPQGVDPDTGKTLHGKEAYYLSTYVIEAAAPKATPPPEPSVGATTVDEPAEEGTWVSFYDEPEDDDQDEWIEAGEASPNAHLL